MQTKHRRIRRSRSTSTSYQRWFVRTTAVATLCTFIAATGTANGSAAAVIHEARPGFAVNNAYQTKPYAPKTQKAQKKKKAETYEERQERIAESKRSLLRPTEENRDAETTCVSGEFTSLRVVYDSLVESLLPSLPPQARTAVLAQQKDAQRAMANITVSTLAISDHPFALGADADDPQYRSPLSNVLVGDLLKIRDGKANEAIPVENITLTQAVETAWLYLFMGVLAPLQVAIGLTPSLGSPLTSAPAPLSSLAGYISYNTLISLTFTATRLGLQYLYQAIANSFINQCVAQVTDEQKAKAGKASEDVVYNIPIAPIIQETANQLALADNDTCTPIGDLTLGRIIQRTGDYAAAITADPAKKRQIKAETAKTLASMKRAYVPHNMIPADPADFSSAESIASMVGSLLPYIGGAPLDIAIGLGHNIGQGDNLLEQVALSDLTVTKSLTAAYYTYYFSLYLFSTIGGLVESPLLTSLGFTTGGVGYLSPVRVAAVILGLPLTYGLVTYHNVIRSMCLVEDDKSGTGKGAEANKLKTSTSPSASATPSTSASASRSAAPSSAPAGRQNSQATTSRKATPSSSKKPAAPQNPAIPDWLPIPR